MLAMITGHFTVALGTLGLLALASTNPASWTARLDSKDGTAITGTVRVETADMKPMPTDTTMPPRDTVAPPTPVPSDPTTTAPASGQVRITLNLNGAPANSTMAWHLHQGKCGSDGALIGDANAYTPVTVDASGTATATTSLSAALQERGEYYADVHTSAEQSASVAACGNLEYQRTRAD
jgi:hypothetical protein